MDVSTIPRTFNETQWLFLMGLQLLNDPSATGDLDDVRPPLTSETRIVRSKVV
jgi:hypothetical protein